MPIKFKDFTSMDSINQGCSILTFDSFSIQATSMFLAQKTFFKFKKKKNELK